MIPDPEDRSGPREFGGQDPEGDAERRAEGPFGHLEGGRTPWGIWDIILAVLAGIGFSVVFGMVAALLLSVGADDPSETLLFSVITSLVYMGVLLGVYLLVIRRRHVRWAETGFHGVGASFVARMVLLTFGVLVANSLIIVLTAALIGDVPTTQEQLLPQEDLLSRTEFAVLFFDVAIAAPLVEELVFRGLLYRNLRSRWSVGPAITVSAAVFAAVHGTPALIPALFFLGFVLGRVTERYGSVYPAVLLHALNNGVAVALLYATQG